MSIKTKTILLLLVSLLITGIIIGGSGIYTLYRQTMAVTGVTMNNQSVQLTDQVTDLVASFHKAGKTYAQDADLQSGDPARIQAKLDIYVGLTSGIARLNFLDTTGKRVALAPYEAKNIGDSLADRQFYKDTTADQQTHISDVIVNRVTGAPSIIVTQPVKNQSGQLVGMVLQALDLEVFQTFLSHVKVGHAGVSAIVAQDGAIIAHSNREMVNQQKKIGDELLARLKSQPGVLQPYTDLAGRDSVALAVPIEGTPWLAVASLPTSEFRTGFYASLTWMVSALLIGLLVVGFIGWRFLLKTLKPIDLLVEEAARIASGDLRASQMKITSQDEIGHLARNFEQMTGNLRNLMRQISEATVQVAASSEELTASAQQSAQAANQVAETITDMAQGASQQLMAVDSATTVVEEMSAGVQQVAANANAVAVMADQSANAAKQGDTAIAAAIAQMSTIEKTVADSSVQVTRLGERSKEIGQIVDTISGIAGQTNLLALNAAIEAARAGEQGRGFSVVAEEVRKLAEQSQEAAKQISDLIGDIQQETGSAVLAMDEGAREVKTGAEVVYNAGQAFKEIGGLVGQVSAQIREISAAIQQMAAGSRQIVTAMRDIDKVSKEASAHTETVSAATEEQSASMEEIASSSQVLAKMAEELQLAVLKFKI